MNEIDYNKIELEMISCPHCNNLIHELESWCIYCGERNYISEEED